MKKLFFIIVIFNMFPVFLFTQDSFVGCFKFQLNGKSEILYVSKNSDDTYSILYSGIKEICTLATKEQCDRIIPASVSSDKYKLLISQSKAILMTSAAELQIGIFQPGYYLYVITGYLLLKKINK
jgi:hypothetical protein